MTDPIQIPKQEHQFLEIRQCIAHRYNGRKDSDAYREQYRPVLLTEQGGEIVLVALDGRRACRLAVSDHSRLHGASRGLYDVTADKASLVELTPHTGEPPVWARGAWEMILSDPGPDTPCVPVSDLSELCYACAAFGVMINPELPVITRGVMFVDPDNTNAVKVVGDGLLSAFMPLSHQGFKRGVDWQAAEYREQQQQQQQASKEG